MPTVIETTDLAELEKAVVSLLQSQPPTHIDGDAYRWQHAEDNRELSPTMVPRSFRVLWGETFEVEGGLTGNADTESGAVLSIEVDYRAVRSEVLGTVLATDREDLHDWLAQSLHPRIKGLMWVGEGRFFSVGEEAERRYSHDFEIHYQRALRRPK